ncbi:hypothetical protein [Bradyrhizobium valentinum]|uniref:hypothetical protein n=1 Tax=Bradyrhizobium valentinum TaxID=1518501 RepID=UPI0012E3CBB7|nr:hypothetical protein [Bradyrhizobium valentinum]
MTSNITKTPSPQCEGETAPQPFDDWLDSIETAVREQVLELIEELIRSQPDSALARPRYERSKQVGRERAAGLTGHRHGRPSVADRQLRADLGRGCPA